VSKNVQLAFSQGFDKRINSLDVCCVEDGFVNRCEIAQPCMLGIFGPHVCLELRVLVVVS